MYENETVPRQAFFQDDDKRIRVVAETCPWREMMRVLGLPILACFAAKYGHEGILVCFDGCRFCGGISKPTEREGCMVTVMCAHSAVSAHDTESPSCPAGVDVAPVVDVLEEDERARLAAHAAHVAAEFPEGELWEGEMCARCRKPFRYGTCQPSPCGSICPRCLTEQTC